MSDWISVDERIAKLTERIAALEAQTKSPYGGMVEYECPVCNRIGTPDATGDWQCPNCLEHRPPEQFKAQTAGTSPEVPTDSGEPIKYPSSECGWCDLPDNLERYKAENAELQAENERLKNCKQWDDAVIDSLQYVIEGCGEERAGFVADLAASRERIERVWEILDSCDGTIKWYRDGHISAALAALDTGGNRG